MTNPAAAPTESTSHWQDLFERLLGELEQRSNPDWQADQASLDPARYCDPGHFARERERLFRRQPLCLGPVDQLGEPGSAMAREVCGVPVLMTRTRDDRVRVFLNVCRHRGAQLVGEDGVACRRQSLVCPYHGWTYRLDGAFAGLPRPEAFPALNKQASGLRELPSSVRHGLIWAVLDPESGPAPDIGVFLGGLDRDLEAIGLGSHRLYRQHAVKRATNWKLVVDAFLEVYHVTRLHAGTIGRFFHDAVAVSDQVGPHQRVLVGRENTAAIRTLPPEHWSPQVHGTLVHYIFPNSVFVYHPDYVSHMGLFPTAADETLFVHSMLIPEAPRTDQAEAHWARSFELIDGGVFNGEDLAVCEQIQRGLKSGANDRLLLGRLEQNLRRFHHSLDLALR